MIEYQGWRIFKHPNGFEVRQSEQSCRIFGTGSLYRAKSLDACKRWIDERYQCHTELTPIGEQYVVPGCEKHIRPAGSQLKLWEA